VTLKLFFQKERGRGVASEVRAGAILPSVWSGPGLPDGSGTAGTLNLPARRFSMEQTSTLDPNYCYTVKELAFLWNMSPESIRRMFVNEPGTLVFRMQATGRRTYRNVRIPGKVALRVQNRMTVVAPVTRPAYGR
jgi:hypothetical protein